MRTQASKARGTVAAAAGLALLGALLPACGPEAPADPTWAADVYPIVQARCARCHSVPVWADPNIPQLTALPRQPTSSFVYENASDVIASAPLFILSASSFIKLEDVVRRMPPSPYTELEDWQIDTIDRWTRNPNRQ
jgi:hypothetical protein